MARWEKTIRQIVRDSHREGAWDLLRAVLDASEHEAGHECEALEFVRRLYRDPHSFDAFVRDSQQAREDR